MRRHLLRNELLLAALVSSAAAVCSLVLPSVSLAASSTIHSYICSTDFAAPTIVEPMSGYRSVSSSVTVKGTGEPGMTVTVLVGGQSKAAAVAAGDGSFAVQVPLAVGGNTLVAREKDSCGNVKDSSEVAVERRQEPEPAPAPNDGGASPSFQEGGRAGRYGLSRFGSFPNVNGGSIGSGEKPPVNETGTAQEPKITSLKEGQVVGDGHIWVAGTGQPGSVIIIYVNGKEVARVVVGEDGTYGAEVTLAPGENAIKAVEERDGKRITTRTWHVTYIKKVAREMSDVRWILWVTVLMAVLLAVLVAWLAYRRHRRKEEVS